MIHSSCGVHNVVHASEQLSIVTVNQGQSVILNLQYVYIEMHANQACS